MQKPFVDYFKGLGERQCQSQGRGHVVRGSEAQWWENDRT